MLSNSQMNAKIRASAAQHPNVQQSIR